MEGERESSVSENVPAANNHHLMSGRRQNTITLMYIIKDGTTLQGVLFCGTQMLKANLFLSLLSSKANVKMFCLQMEQN